MSQQCIGTQYLHTGYTPRNGEPRNIPIVQSTTFRYATGEQMEALFDLEESGYFYTRPQNPMNDYMAAKICALEGGTATILTSSGQAASFHAIFDIVSCGEHVVCSSSIYGSTCDLLATTMKRMDINFTLVDPSCTEVESGATFRPETRVVFGETIANPALTILDFERFARVAHAYGMPLIVDNTFTTPVGCRPFEWGANIVTHSTTKCMDSHANTVGGAIVDSGRFDQTAHADEFSGLTTPDESYHGVAYTERFGLEGAYVTKTTAQLMRDFNTIPTPMNVYLLNAELETLPLRMAGHCENAPAMARFLEGRPKVSWMRYPSLGGDPCYERARKYLLNGTCGVVSFGMKGGQETASKFMAGLELAPIVTHVADTKTCVLYPASTTHHQMSDAELTAAGVTPDLVHFSVDIKDVNNILVDLGKALEEA